MPVSRRLPTTFFVIAAAAVIVSACWAVGALWFQAPVPAWAAALLAAIWIVLAAAVAVRLRRPGGRIGLGLYALGLAALIGWWTTLVPSNDRDWADEVARELTGEINGSRATLHNVRNFAWRSETDYTPRWETREYDLDKLESVDMVLSYWGLSAIAHTLVSFGFSDGQRVVFSVEIRKERHESFSALGGFFKKFDMSVVAADENDIVRVRSNARGEDVYLYHVRLSPQTMRSLFMAYVAEANSVAAKPRFYNTLTANCTTIVYHMMTRIVDGLTLDYRLLASGYLARYVHDVGGLEPGYSLQTLHELGRITGRARQVRPDEDFSTEIRRGVPGADPAVHAAGSR